jgi:hypothetical protein
MSEESEAEKLLYRILDWVNFVLNMLHALILIALFVVIIWACTRAANGYFFPDKAKTELIDKRN